MNYRIGITGSRGFIGAWVARRLSRESQVEVTSLDRAAWDSPDALRRWVASCDVIVHLAGVNRGEPAEVESMNLALAQRLTDACRAAAVTPHLIYSSTTKRKEDSPYGRGKRRAEQVFAAWAEETGGGVTTLVVPNVFGAGCRPYYNSVVATFCHQLARGEQPTVAEDRTVEFLWVGALAERIAAVATGPKPGAAVTIPVHGQGELRISELLTILDGFRADHFDRDVVPDLTSPLVAALYSTFQWHVALADHAHRPPLRSDARGDLCEVIKTTRGGQVFFSTTKPGVTRGNHYHTRKAEWFCVVRGEATIRLRALGEERVHTFEVSGESPEFLSIPVLHAHSIENSGQDELLTLFWSSEVFDPADPDTYAEDVIPRAAVPLAA